MVDDFINNIVDFEAFKLKIDKLFSGESDIVSDIFDYKSPNHSETQKLKVMCTIKEINGKQYFIGGVKDLTHEMKTSNDLIERQKDLNIVYDTLRDVEDSNKFSIQSLDANCKFHWTPGIYDILELEPQESDEHENIILNCLDDNVRKEIEDKVAHLPPNELLGNHELKVTTGKGNTKFILLNVKKAYDDKSNFVQESAYCRDITDEYIQKRKSEFLSTVLEYVHTDLGTGAFIWDSDSNEIVVTDYLRDTISIPDSGNVRRDLQVYFNHLADYETYRKKLDELYSGVIDKIDEVWEYINPQTGIFKN